MLEVIFEIFMYLLAVYGALTLIMGVYNSICSRTNEVNYGVKLVLIVKNQEETIEGIIRNVFIGDYLRKMLCYGKLTVVDMGSKDRTMDILNKLQEDFVNLDVMQKEDKENIFLDFEDNTYGIKLDEVRH